MIRNRLKEWGKKIFGKADRKQDELFSQLKRLDSLEDEIRGERSWRQGEDSAGTGQFIDYGGSGIEVESQSKMDQRGGQEHKIF